MTISTGNQEIVIGDLHQLIVTDRNQENVFSCKSNRTLAEMLKKEKYLNLSISFEEYLPEYGDMNIGAFLILLKKRGDDKYKMFLNRNGDKRYCKFTLTDVDLSQKGLYVYVLNNEIKYLGRCLTNFKDRIISNYGRITATNCYKDGQSTNCHINSIINNTSVNVFVGFYPMTDNEEVKSLEREILITNNFEWNIQLQSKVEKKQ